MGGLRVLPSRAITDVDPADAGLLILPGGDYWERLPLDPRLEAGVRRLDAAGVPLAAICAATTAVARWGLLRGRFHTSNGLTYLRRQVPDYDAAATYVDAPAVRDAGLITASGLADVEFAREIMTQLAVLSDSDRDLWQRMFRSGQLPDRKP
jgi:putative intracellular protease/amidase